MKEENQIYSPPYEITPTIVDLIARIDAFVDRLSPTEFPLSAPHWRRETRIQSVQASLHIEGNTLRLDQVAAVLAGKGVLGSPREIQEVDNALAAYDQLENLAPGRSDDLCHTHAVLMHDLVEEPGTFRKGSIGIRRGDDMVLVAPPAEQVPILIDDLLEWVQTTEAHPLIASSVFHYEFECIHPFMDGNGPLGRLWQRLILGRWKPVFFMMPIESVLRDHLADYYSALSRSDDAGNSTAFIEFLLSAILAACQPLAGEAQASHR